MDELMKKYELYTKLEGWDKVSVFGLSHVCKNSLSLLKTLVKIEYILDNNKELDGKEHEGIPIYLFNRNNELFKTTKILITTHYKEIAQQLFDAGLRENIDFCSIEEFLILISWYRENKIYVNEVHLSVTTKCTLRCQNCNMFMAEYKNPSHLNLNELKEDIDVFFEKVDFVSTFALLGGEPLIYPELGDLISYLCQYKTQIGVLEIITNGTVVPNIEMLKLFRQNKVFFRISDYSKAINYSNQLDKLKKCLREAEISYYINESMTWLDFGFPHNCVYIPADKVYQHMLDCAPAFKGLNNKKLYFCHIVWSANKCGIYEEKESDYLDMMTCSREDIVKYALGIMEKPVSLCQLCAGCSSDNHSVIEIAIQKQEK